MVCHVLGGLLGGCLLAAAAAQAAGGVHGDELHKGKGDGKGGHHHEVGLDVVHKAALEGLGVGAVALVHEAVQEAASLDVEGHSVVDAAALEGGVGKLANLGLERVVCLGALVGKVIQAASQEEDGAHSNGLEHQGQELSEERAKDECVSAGVPSCVCVRCVCVCVCGKTYQEENIDGEEELATARVVLADANEANHGHNKDEGATGHGQGNVCAGDCISILGELLHNRGAVDLGSHRHTQNCNAEEQQQCVDQVLCRKSSRGAGWGKGGMLVHHCPSHNTVQPGNWLLSGLAASPQKPTQDTQAHTLAHTHSLATLSSKHALQMKENNGVGGAGVGCGME